MVKAFGTSMIAEELIGASLGAEMLTGQLELVVAEAAILGAVLLVKHFKKKKQEKAQQPNQDDPEEPEPTDINEEDQDGTGQIEQPNQQDEDEPEPTDIEWDDVINQEAQQLQSESEQRIASLEQQNNLIEPGVVGPQQTPDEMFLIPPEIREDFEDFRRRRDDPDPNGNGGGDNGDPDPNDGGGGNNDIRNPYQDMLDYLQYIQFNIIQREKEQQQDNEADDADMEEQLDDENIHLIQDELEAQLAALGQQQLTAEKTYVELERIEKMIDDQIPDQVLVDPYTIYSSDVILF